MRFMNRVRVVECVGRWVGGWIGMWVFVGGYVPVCLCVRVYTPTGEVSRHFTHT